MVDNKHHIPFKILMTADTVGGVWTYCMELCQGLLPYGVQVHLVTAGMLLKEAQKAQVAALPNIILYETAYKLEWMEQPWEDIEVSGEWLLALEKEIGPDVIHLNSYAYGALPFSAPVLSVAHSDVCSWWKAVKNAQPPMEWNTYYQKVKSGLENVDMIIAPTHAVIKEIENIYAPGVLNKIIYNGRSKAPFYIKEKQKFIFSMGRLWDEAKNIQLLAAAAPHVNATIKVAGDNTFQQQALNSVDTNVEYVGFLNTQQVADQLAAAAVYALPARYEPFGLSVLEAAFSGCALVLGAIESLQEIWGKAALYVDTNDALALADMLNYLMKNDSVRLRYAKRAYQQAQNFETSKMVQQYYAVYQQLMHQKQLTKQAIA